MFQNFSFVILQSQIKTVCSSYPEMVSSSASLVEQFGLQPVDITEQFNTEVIITVY